MTLILGEVMAIPYFSGLLLEEASSLGKKSPSAINTRACEFL
jgi:hypothetical protein